MPSLTETHRRAQLALRAQVLRDLYRLWSALDWNAIDRTYPLWATVVGGLVQRYRSTSSGLAAAYLRALREESGVPGMAPIVLADPVEPERLDTVLRVTAAGSLKAAAARGTAQEAALASAFVRSAGAVTRLALEGGRRTILGSIDADECAVGYRRVTSGSACDFCRMLASRGAVYLSRQSALTTGSTRVRGTQAPGSKYHDHCACTVEPIYEC